MQISWLYCVPDDLMIYMVKKLNNPTNLIYGISRKHIQISNISLRLAQWSSICCRGRLIIYFNYSFCLEIPCFARHSGLFMKCSEITNHFKSEQDLASFYRLLVVKGFCLLRKRQIIRRISHSASSATSMSKVRPKSLRLKHHQQPISVLYAASGCTLVA